MYSCAQLFSFIVFLLFHCFFIVLIFFVVHLFHLSYFRLNIHIDSVFTEYVIVNPFDSMESYQRATTGVYR